MDKLRLEYEIKRNGFANIEEFCEKIGMSRSAFYRKTNGISDFTLGEIDKIVETLRLDGPMEIFFNKEVS